jgi:hypothetical protein
MTTHPTAVALAALMVAGATSSWATDGDVLRCRATEAAHTQAGQCGAHGCDCGLLKSECAASWKYLNSGAMDPQGAAYMREAYAYKHDCVGAIAGVTSGQAQMVPGAAACARWSHEFYETSKLNPTFDACFALFPREMTAQIRSDVTEVTTPPVAQAATASLSVQTGAGWVWIQNKGDTTTVQSLAANRGSSQSLTSVPSRSALVNNSRFGLLRARTSRLPEVAAATFSSWRS